MGIKHVDFEYNSNGKKGSDICMCVHWRWDKDRQIDHWQEFMYSNVSTVTEMTIQL